MAQLSPEDVTTLIDHLLKTKDPATVGLRRIIKKKEEQSKEFPLQSMRYDDFATASGKTKVFSEEEQRVLELEKRVAGLTRQITQQKAASEQAVTAAYEKGKAEGKQAGTKQGYDQAKKEFDEQVAQAQQQIDSVVRALKHKQDDVFHNARHLVVRLAGAIARRVINTEVQANPDIVLGVVKKALSHVADTEKLVVRVARDDVQAVTGNKDFWLPVGEGVKNLTIEEDERIDRGGCILESNAGMVDGRLGVQFSELEELIEKTWESVALDVPDTGEPFTSDSTPPSTKETHPQNTVAGRPDAAADGRSATDGAASSPPDGHAAGDPAVDSSPEQAGAHQQPAHPDAGGVDETGPGVSEEHREPPQPAE